MIPADDMMIFVEVVRHKSFTIAAEKMNFTPAAISAKVSKLESSLGVKLLKRTTRSLALTDAGQILFDQCRDVKNLLGNVVETVRNEHSEIKGNIRISSMPNFSNVILAPILDKFLQLYPDLDIDINLDNGLYTLPALDEYDLAFRSGDLDDSSAIVRKIMTHDYTICATKIYYDRHGFPNTLKDLENHNCVDCSHGLRNAQNIWRLIKEEKIHEIPVSGNIKSDNALFIKHLALNNVALAYSPSFIVAEEINQGILIPALPEYKTPINEISMVHPYTDRIIPQRVRVLIDFIVKNLQIPRPNK